jgi:2-polyprenyl-3-methyl-5-hydroxy-6-metoxy-1,4-benzoquinol methylase
MPAAKKPVTKRATHNHMSDGASAQPTPIGSTAWETLAQVYAGSRQVSADSLVEWPAQRALVCDFRGKRILDVWCGGGDKSPYFADEGALSRFLHYLTI